MSGISEMVTSVAPKGMAKLLDDRSCLTLDEKATSRDAVQLRRHAQQYASTRAQLKFRGRLDDVPPSARHLVDAVFAPTVASSEYPTQSGVIFMSANAEGRRDPTLQYQWDVARAIWREPLRMTPEERLNILQEQGYTSDTNIRPEDASSLHELWGPFGWGLEGVEQFREVYDPRDSTKAGWFACMRDQEGIMVSAAKAEALAFYDLMQIESTEWGTHSNMRGKGLGTGAVIALNQAILQRPPNLPYVIMAEANLAPDLPGHRVARDAGFTPAGADMNSSVPNHILRAHVSVDSALRSFLPVQLTPDAITQYYSS